MAYVYMYLSALTWCLGIFFCRFIEEVLLAFEEFYKVTGCRQQRSNNKDSTKQEKIYTRSYSILVSCRRQERKHEKRMTSITMESIIVNNFAQKQNSDIRNSLGTFIKIRMRTRVELSTRLCLTLYGLQKYVYSKCYSSITSIIMVVLGLF